MNKPHIRLHVGPCILWWAETYIDCKHGWDVTAPTWSARSALRKMLQGETRNRRGYLAQWPNQLRGPRIAESQSGCRDAK